MATAIGPMTQMETLMAAFSFDIHRALYLPLDETMALTVPDATVMPPPGYRVVQAFTTGWDRASRLDEIKGDGRTVVFLVADVTGQMRDWLREAEYVLFQGEHIKINDAPDPQPDQAQVYVITCGVGTMVKRYIRKGRG